MDPVTVIILAGGYGEDMVAELRALSSSTNSKHSNLKATVTGLTRSIVDAGPGGPSVCRALLEINNHPTLISLLISLSRASRASPLCQNAYIVANDQDVPRFTDDHGRFQTMSRGAINIPAANIIPNASTCTADWGGEVADLKTALSIIQPPGHVVVISASLLFLGEFNIQRVIEHSMVRGKDTIAYEVYGTADEFMRGPQAPPLHVVDASAPGPLPELRSLTPSYATPGDSVAAPLVILKPSSLGAVMNSASRELEGMMMGLMEQSIPVCGVELGTGVFRMWNAVSVDYLDRFLFYFYSKKKEGTAEKTGDGDYVPSLGNYLEKTLNDFDGMYFGPGGYFSPVGSTKHKVPPTFYMTTYRRQAAELLR